MRELSLNVMDIVQNSVRAGASLITVQVAESKKHDTLTITITDNGCGMSAEQVKSVIDPFFTTRTTRKVGLGVPLFKMEAEMTGGSFQIDSEEGKGTKVTAVFRPSHVDMIPLGDIASVIHLLITCNPELDFLFTLQCRRKRDHPRYPYAARAAGGRSVYRACGIGVDSGVSCRGGGRA